MHDLLQSLKQRQLVWQAGQAPLSKAPQMARSTGFKELDSLLQGGYPTQGVVEIESQPGIGELRLLAPHLQNSEGQIAFIQPPFALQAAFFQSMGFDLSRLLVLKPSTPQHALWAAEQCLKSGACRHVLLWHDELEIHQVKRLQLACSQGDALLFVHKPLIEHRLSLPVALSLQLQPADHGIKVKVLKRKGGWTRGEVTVDFSAHYPHLVARQPIERTNTVVPFVRAQQG